MKNTGILFLLFSTFIIFGQAPTQKDILGFPNVDLVKDYNYNISKKTPIKISQKWFALRDSKFKHVENTLFEFDSKSLKIKQKKSKDTNPMYNHYWTNYSYSYKENQLQKREINEKGKIIDLTKYSYNSNKIISRIVEHYDDIILSVEYNYPSTDNTTIVKKTNKTNTKTNKVLLDLLETFTLKNGLIIEKKIANQKLSKEYIIDFKYNDNNLLNEKSPYETFLGVFQLSSSPTIGYKYDNFGHLISETSLTGISDIRQFYFEYIYDDYGNWIAKFKIWNKDIFDSKSKITTEIEIRTIEYRDQTTTGFTSIDTSEIQEYLKRKNFAKTSPPDDGVYWSKETETAFKIYSNGNAITGNLNFINVLINDLYVNDSITNTFYQLKGFKQKPIQKDYYKVAVFANKDEAVWYKAENNDFGFYVNGVMPNISNNLATSNSKDRIIYIDNIPKYAIFFEDTKIYEMQKAITYQDYLKTYPNEGKKEVVEEIPLGAVWKKSDNGGFWFYTNRENRSQKINYYYFSNHCVVYDTITKQTFFFENYKTATVNKFNNAIELTGNQFWYKTDTNKFNVIINAKIVTFKHVMYAQNNIDIVLLNDNNEKLFIAKDFKNKGLNIFSILNNYSDYTEKPSEDYILSEKVKNCNADKKCLANLYDEMYDVYKEQSTEDQLAKKMANYIEKVYNVHPHLAFTVLMTNKRNINIIKPLMEKLPKDISTSIRSGSRDMLNDYNKYINSKEVRDKVKENGGSYIEN